MKQLGQEDVSTGTNSTSKKVLAATAKSVKNVPKFVSLETKLHLERRGEPVIGLDQIEVIKPLFDNSLIVSGVSLSEVKIGDNPAGCV